MCDKVSRGALFEQKSSLLDHCQLTARLNISMEKGFPGLKLNKYTTYCEEKQLKVLALKASEEVAAKSLPAKKMFEKRNSIYASGIAF